MTGSAVRLEHQWAKTACSFDRTTRAALALPFDVLREHYAKAVRAGLVQGSMLASRDLERVLAALEHATLGPWARSV
jgi:hypothetical protein